MLQILSISYKDKLCRIYGATADENGGLIGEGALFSENEHVSTAMLEALKMCRYCGHGRLLMLTDYELLYKLWKGPVSLRLPEMVDLVGVKFVWKTRKDGAKYPIVVKTSSVPGGNTVQWAVARELQQFIDGWQIRYMVELPREICGVTA